MADIKNLFAANKFSLLRRFSIASLAAMLVTAAILIFLYRQDQLTEHEGIAAQENAEAAIRLTHLLDDQINTFVTTSDGFDSQAIRTNPNIGLFTAALEMAREHDILKLRIFNRTGVTLYSPSTSEIGEMSSHPDLLAQALSGEVRQHVDFRKTFFSATGEMHDVHVALTFLPLTHAGKRIGAIEIYNDVTPVFNRIRANTIHIALIVFCAFAALYAALCFYVRRTDCAIVEWQKLIADSEEKSRITATAFETQEGMIITDAQGVILKVNHAFTQITGYTAEEAIGQTPRLLKSDRQDAAFYAEMWESLLRNGAWHGEIWNRRKNGEVYPEYHTITAVKGGNGETTHYVATMNDISMRKQAEEQIRALAFYDTLTQLPNRRLLNDRLGQTLAASKRSGRYGALMFIDLDNFKPLNDTYGHGVGDLLLIEVAHRLTSCVREVDTVARFGGDEFVVILSELGADKTESLAQATLVAGKTRATLAEPYMLGIPQDGKVEAITVVHHCTSSIGVVLFISYESSAENILKWADRAMYQAKDAGRNLIQFYDSTA